MLKRFWLAVSFVWAVVWYSMAQILNENLDQFGSWVLIGLPFIIGAVIWFIAWFTIGNRSPQSHT